MALTYRGQLDRPLTSEEIDANFAYFTGSQSITGSITVSGSIIPTVGTGELTSSFSLGSETAAWKDIYVSNGSIKFIQSGAQPVTLSSKDGGIQVNNGPVISDNGINGQFYTSKSLDSDITVKDSNNSLLMGPIDIETGKEIVVEEDSDLTIFGDIESTVPDNLSVYTLNVNSESTLAGRIYLKYLTSCSSTNVLVYNPSTGLVCYQTASNLLSSTPGGLNREIQYNDNGVLGGVTDVKYLTTPSVDFPSSSGANVELRSTNINVYEGDVEFGSMGYSIINAVSYISASASSSINLNGLSVYPSGATQLNYGVNVIEQANASNYCVIMPATPRKGKELTVINNSGIPIYVFGESENASLNNIIGNHIVLPSDGVAYKFVCYDNPLPGGWSIVSTNALNIINSGIIGGNSGLLISQSTIPNPYYYQSATVVNNDIYALDGKGIGVSNTWAYDLLNTPSLYDAGIDFFPGDGVVWGFFTPNPNWKKINRITIYTNLSSSANNAPYMDLQFGFSNNINYYQAGTQILDYPALEQGNITPAALQTFVNDVITPFWTDLGLNNTFEQTAGSMLFSTLQGGTINTVPGTLTPTDPGYVPISENDFTGYLSSTPGEPGTTYYTMNFDYVNSEGILPIGKACGMEYLGTVNTPSFFGGVDALDAYAFGNIGVFFSFGKTTYINGLKLKIAIEYTELT